MAARHAARSARRGRLAQSVVEARRPKLLAASTRLAPGQRTLAAAPESWSAPAQSWPAPQSRPAASPAPRPALQEMYGMSDAAYEWVFGNPQQALARSDVVAGGMPNLAESSVPSSEA